MRRLGQTIRVTRGERLTNFRETVWRVREIDLHHFIERNRQRRRAHIGNPSLNDPQ